jgi:glycosyltransferase involved in cell wall biosynthesis
MKVCLLGYNENFFWRGSATLKVQKNVHKYLNLNSVDCDLFTCSDKKNFFSVLFDPIEFIQNENGRIISGGVVPFIKHLTRAKYDLIHMIVTRNYMALVALLSFIYRTKTVVTFHDTLNFPYLPSFKKNEIKLFLVKWILFKVADMLFVYNEVDVELIKQKYSERKIRFIKNGVESECFNHLNEGKNKSTILFSGGKKRQYKGYEFLLSSLTQTKQKIRLLTCGDDEGKNTSKNDLGELSPSDFLKILTEVGVLIVPSSYDSFSISVLEAMAVGTPVILTNECGVSRYLKSGEGCYIVNYGDANNLAEKIDLLVQNSELWIKMSKEASIVAKRFMWSETILDYKNHYSTLVNK